MLSECDLLSGYDLSSNYNNYFKNLFCVYILFFQFTYYFKNYLFYK